MYVTARMVRPLKDEMKYLYKYFVYISLVFLVVGLYRAHYLTVPTVISYPAILLSLIFLFLGFVTGAISWKKILERSHYHVDIRECLAGTGLSIFGKYIPGKIWLIVGRAAYIANVSGYSLGKLSALSLNAQFINLWMGLILGTFGLFTMGQFRVWGWLILILVLGLTAVIFSRPAHNAVQSMLTALVRKKVEIPYLSIRSTFSVMPWFALNWMLWSVGFYILIIGLKETGAPWNIGLGLPFACTLGIMAVITPGGLGAREGAMVGYLTLAGISVGEATTIAIASRLWFLIGDVFIFILGWATHTRANSTPRKGV